MQLPTPMSSPRIITDSPEKSNDTIFHCRVCFRGLSTANAADPLQPSFWLTSCGHIVCSSHVFPNGVPPDAADTTNSCPYCEKKDVSLAGVNGGEPPAGLRDYFAPPIELLENFTGALRAGHLFLSLYVSSTDLREQFQCENLLRYASHHKTLADKLSEKLENQKGVLLRVKDELLEARELKKENPILQAEVAQLRQENDQLRAQLNRSPGQQQMNSQPSVQSAQPPKPPDLSISSPSTAQDNPLKRKADAAHDENSRVREFRRELNGRHAMPPPAIPISYSSSNISRNRQSPMLQHGKQAEQFISRDKYGNYQNTLEQDMDFQQNQFFQGPNDRGFSHPQSQNFSNSHQGYQNPPQTPRQPFVPQDASQSFNPNPPFRTPLPLQRTYATDPSQQDNQVSYLSPPTSRTGFQYHMNNRSSPAAPQSRLSLAPQTSSGYPYSASVANPRGREGSTTYTGGSGASPFFSRPTSVAAFGNNSRSAFQTPFLRGQRPQSAMPNASGHGNGGLGELLRGSGGFMDRPGLRRSVRRD